MEKTALINVLSCAEPFACVIALLLIYFRKQIGQYKFLATFLLIRIVSLTFLIALMFSSVWGVKAKPAYHLYFYIYWWSYAIEACLGFGIIYSLYKLAMAPLKGLQRLGMLMFRWAAGVAVALAITMALGPHVTGIRFAIKVVSQLQQTQSVLTLCMLLFVCLAIRPMGLSYRSKIFGVSLGLGLLATSDLVGSAWLSLGMKMSSTYNIINGITVCATLLIWVTYFILPEPKRRMIVLPTTSPFLRWNQISLALGDEPGFVAVGDVSPDMFAPAEIEIMRRASLKISNARNH